MNIKLPQRSKGRPRFKQPQIRRTVIVSDLHIPEMDIAAYNTVRHFLRDQRPDYLFLAGDLLDMHSFSSFLKDPSLDNRTEESLEQANTVLDELQEASPNTLIKVVFGNHCNRITKFLWQVPEILPFVTKGKKPIHLLADTLSLDERGIDWVGYPEVYNHWGFYITHGEYANIHAAKRELEQHGVSGISGHVHSNKYWERRGRNGVAQWWSIGGMPNRNVSYRPNNGWVQGIALLEQEIDREEHFTLHPLPIVQGQFIYNNKIYCQDGAFEAK